MFQSIWDLFKLKLLPLLKSSGLKGRATRGGIWLGIGSFSDNGGRLLRQILLARILTPDDFGLMALILAVNQFFESFTQIGLREAVIQNPRGNKLEYLNTAFWLSAGRGAILYIIAFMIAPWIADFYNKFQHPDIVPMMRIAFLGILLYGVISPKAYSELKKMNYRRWVIVFHGGSLIGILVAITLGFFIRNVWALVIGNAVEHFARMVLSYIFCPFVPSFSVDNESFKSLLRFARGMFGIPIMVFIYARADVFVIAKLYSEDTLGYYGNANILAQIPLTLYNTIIHPILLPAFSPYQNDPGKLSQMVLKASKYIGLIFIPILTLLACFSEHILTIVYTAPYAVASVPFIILCANMGIRIFGAIIVSALLALGRPEYTRDASLVRLLVILILIYPMVKYYGLNGAACTVCIASIAWLLISLVRLKKHLGLSIIRYLSSYIPGLAISVGIVVMWTITNGLLK